MKKIIKNHKTKILIIVLLVATFLLCGGATLLKTTFSNTLHYFENVFQKEEIKKVTFNSDNYTHTAKGEYKVEKSADWIDKNTAMIEFNVNSNVMTNGKKKDVILTIDISGSMKGEKYEKLKTDATELLTNLLADSENTASLVLFSYDSQIIIEHSNNLEELLEALNNVEVSGGTNYYQALAKTDEVLQDYVPKEDRDCVVIFLTDGFPTTNNHNQTAQFEVINSKYPYLTIYGIQYEMGIGITQELKEVTHKQYAIIMDELRNVLYDAAFEPIRYQEFILTDYINEEYFYIESESDIKASIGKATLVTENNKQKIVWDLTTDEYISGTQATLEIKIKLKEGYLSKDGYYPTNEKVEITANIDGKDKSLTTNLTPQLKHGYTTTYDMNTPEGCNLDNLSKETHYAYEVVEKSSIKPSCSGYKFQGWETTTKLQYVNNDYYIMPTKDITFKAIWAKLSISKSVDGKVYKRQTLYNVLKKEAELGLTAKEYDGLGSDKYENKVYYFNGKAENTHVIFADFCWKMVRTTDTGGVKLVYDGLPKNGVCNNTGVASQVNETYVQYNSQDGSPANLGFMYNTRYASSYTTMSNRTKTVASSNVYISQEYTKNSNGNYSLTNPLTITPAQWKENHEDYVGYYACSTPTATTCSEIRRIVFTEEGAYFYNIIYLYGKSVEYVYDEATQKYVYKLVDPIEINDLRNNMDKINDRHFTCGTRNDTCTSVKYIHHIRNTTGIIQMNHITLSNGLTIEDAIHNMLYADDVNTKNSTIKTYIENWYANNMTNYSKFIEDTVYCNDRRIAEPNGWDVNGDASKLFLFYSHVNRDLTCGNTNDKFTVSEDIGNGKLAYPVGLLTAAETEMVGYDILGTNNYYWTMSPSLYSNSSAYIYTMSSSQSLVLDNLAVTYKNIPLGVRPVISLKPEISYISGDGSSSNPYIVNSRSVE